MGSKNNPGKFDCLAKAELDEPMFVLLGRDPVASELVRGWADLRERMDLTEPEVLDEARACAEEMERWLKFKGREDKLEAANAAVCEAIQERRDQGAEREARKSRELYERVLKLQNLCHRTADVIEVVVALLGTPDAVGSPELLKLVKELRGA